MDLLPVPKRYRYKKPWYFWSEPSWIRVKARAWMENEGNFLFKLRLKLISNRNFLYQFRIPKSGSSFVPKQNYLDPTPYECKRIPKLDPNKIRLKPVCPRVHALSPSLLHQSFIWRPGSVHWQELTWQSTLNKHSCP